MVMGEGCPRIAVGTVVLPYRAPLPLAHVWTPAEPGHTVAALEEAIALGVLVGDRWVLAHGAPTCTRGRAASPHAPRSHSAFQCLTIPALPIPTLCIWIRPRSVSPDASASRPQP